MLIGLCGGLCQHPVHFGKLRVGLRQILQYFINSSLVTISRKQRVKLHKVASRIFTIACQQLNQISPRILHLAAAHQHRRQHLPGHDRLWLQLLPQF